MLNYQKIILAILVYAFQYSAFCQDRGDVRIMFYNVENYFDTVDDSLKNDNEFTPEGEKHWNKYRYREKRNNIYKVIANVGGWSPPEIVGLCEIENRNVLYDLVENTPLLKYPYGIVHYESPDRRGIDVALLYRKNEIEVLHSQNFKIASTNKIRLITRDILYAKIKTKSDDTLHIFVNHWPSRSGGQIRSEPKRMLAASVLRQKVDSLLKTNDKLKIVIMGDFNDTPENRSIQETLGANLKMDSIINTELYNLSKGDKNIGGSYRYKGQWNLLDNMIVSGFLLNTNEGLRVTLNSYFIVDYPFLLTEEKNGLGVKPFRTYQGPKYLGGYSDHFPVVLDLWLH